MSRGSSPRPHSTEASLLHPAGSPTPSARARTLKPLLRKFMLAVLVVVWAMIALSAIGIRHRATARRGGRRRHRDRLRRADAGARRGVRRVLPARRRVPGGRVHRGGQPQGNGRGHLDALAAGKPGGQHGNYGSALTAHPGEPQGRPDKGSGSRPMVRGSACPHLGAPGPRSGRSHHSAGPGGPAGHLGTAFIMPDLRRRHGAAGRSRRLAAPLQPRAPAPRLPQPGPPPVGDRRALRQPVARKTRRLRRHLMRRVDPVATGLRNPLLQGQQAFVGRAQS